MIEFKCHCSQPIQTPDDEAGGMIQCPRCGRLNDVPTLSDLRNLDADGSFKLTDLEIVDEPTRLRHITQAFTRSRVDDSGDEIDLRSTPEDVARAGIDEIPLADESAVGDTPKYDPLTGELVVPLMVKKETKFGGTGPIPMATAVLGYRVATPHERGGIGWIGLKLFQPQNITVMFFVFITHVFLQIAIIPVAAGLFFFAIIPLALVLGLAGHYGRIVEATGPLEQDDLPIPFGSMSFVDDFWNPFVATALALMFSFLPWYLMYSFAPPGEARWVGHGIGVLIGALLFPAAFLTAATAGSFANMRPDRVLSVIKICGRRYIGAVLLFILGPTIYCSGVTGVLMGTYALFIKGLLKYPGLVGGLGVFCLVFGIYLTHWACWSLGMLYRAHNQQFPWILQRHEYRNRTHQPPRRAARRPAAAPTVRSKP